MLISGVGVTAPLYASQVFSTISGEKKGYVTCVHFIFLVLFIGHYLKSMHVKKATEKRSADGLPDNRKDRSVKT